MIGLQHKLILVYWRRERITPFLKILWSSAIATLMILIGYCTLSKLRIKSIVFFLFFLLRNFNGDFKIGLTHIFFKLDAAMQDLQPALNIFQSQPDRAFVELLKV